MKLRRGRRRSARAVIISANFSTGICGKLCGKALCEGYKFLKILDF
jgi:hypothetical protein